MNRLPIRPLALLMLLATFALPAWARGGGDAELDLTGTYTIVDSKLPDGTAYEGKVEIKRKKSDIGMVLWDLAWHLTGREKPIHGIGMLFDDQVLCVAYAPTEDYGMVVYAPVTERHDWLLRDDDLFGLWFNSSGTVGREALHGAVDTYSGTYRLHGHTLAKSGPTRHYNGAIEVTPAGESLSLRVDWRWKNLIDDKQVTFSGIGLEVPGMLLAGWGLGDGGIGIYTIDGERLVGMFAQPDGVGNERLVMPAEVLRRLARRRPE